MLYPLSYEGLPCAFTQRTGSFRPVGLGLDTSCPTGCAASVPRAVWSAPAHRPTRGADCTDGDAGSSLQGQEQATGSERTRPAWKIG
jgi:hypothetical protein